MEGLEIRELARNEDQRGWLAEMIRHDETDLRPVMSYISMTKPGLARGPHEHREQTDCFCFIGRFTLYVWDNREGSPTYGEHRVIDIGDLPTLAVIPPGIVHAYKNTGGHDGLVINLPDRLYRGWGKADDVDEVRYENHPDSPFRMEG
ncbi:MAG: dTDP-4-dehydrorhamnose 3,5-epimerase family protein [Nitrospiraceae bacterium]|nr:MAG: dTDP-4-dehydrorhamnose 3,5-epimerase family protein [Nitrospiraceae bacterium]